MTEPTYTVEEMREAIRSSGMMLFDDDVDRARIEDFLSALPPRSSPQFTEEHYDAIRKGCPACDNGVGGVDPSDGSAIECEYCGRLLAALRASQQQEKKP